MQTTPYLHCSRCGSGRMVSESAREVVCEECRYRHFLTPIPAACAVVLDAQERILLARRAHEPGFGKWGLPGGVIEPAESAEVAAARELREEVGIELPSAAFRYLASFNNNYLFQDFVWPTLDLYFVARLESSPPAQADPREVSEVQWCPLAEVPLGEFAFDSNVRAIRLLRGW